MPDLVSYSAMTFGDLLLEMAVECGVARYVSDSGDDSAALLPDDLAVLAKLKMRLNAGYKQFLLGVDPLQSAAAGKANPVLRPYSNWTFLNRPVSITLAPNGDGPLNLAGDNSRYRLPDGITSAPNQGWTINNSGTYDGSRVISTTVERVLDNLAWTTSRGPQTGCPVMSATRPIANPSSADGGKAWEVIIAPRPSTAMTMTTNFRVQARDLRDLNDVHIAGAEHDRTILAFAILEWMRRDDAGSSNYARYAQAASAALAGSIQLDKRSRGSVVGTVSDPGVNRPFVDRGMVASISTGTVSYVPGIR